VWWDTSIIPATWDVKVRELWLEYIPGKKPRTERITKAKRTGGMVQVVKHQPSKQKAPYSNLM
jgi:hypothetical protein